jgi:hypothetical protein
MQVLGVYLQCNEKGKFPEGLHCDSRKASMINKKVSTPADRLQPR